MEVQSSSSFKLRALLRQLRPRFLEVLRTPDFRHCKAAHEIRKDMELLMKLHKQMALETSQPAAGKAAAENHSLETGLRPNKEAQQRKKLKLAEPKGFAQRAVESEASAQTSFGSSEKKGATGGLREEGSYIIGGSVSGWNFITFSGSKPVYYGVKKESFRSSQKARRKY